MKKLAGVLPVIGAIVGFLLGNWLCFDTKIFISIPYVGPLLGLLMMPLLAFVLGWAGYLFMRRLNPATENVVPVKELVVKSAGPFLLVIILGFCIFIFIWLLALSSLR